MDSPLILGSFVRACACVRVAGTGGIAQGAGGVVRHPKRRDSGLWFSHPRDYLLLVSKCRTVWTAAQEPAPARDARTAGTSPVFGLGGRFGLGHLVVFLYPGTSPSVARAYPPNLAATGQRVKFHAKL